MGFKVTVAYYSTSQGVTQQQTGEAITYYGKVFKIPKELFSKDGDVDFQHEIEELLEEIQKKALEPVTEEVTVERYETWGVDDDNVWVMYRIPCKESGTQPS